MIHGLFVIVVVSELLDHFLEKKITKTLKHDRAIEKLAGGNYIVRTPVHRISETISGLSFDKRPAKRLNNDDKMYKKLYRII